MNNYQNFDPVLLTIYIANVVVAKYVNCQYVIPGHNDWNTHRSDCYHGHRAPCLCCLHLLVVGVDGTEGSLEVIVVVVVPVVVGVHNHVADVIERHQHKCHQVVGVEAKVSNSAGTI